MKVLVIDVGGTNIKYALLEEVGKNIPSINGYKSVSTPESFSSITAVLNNIINLSAHDAVVICLPGVYNHMDNSVVFAPNIPLTGKNILEALNTDKPVFFENDAKLAALGEYRYGFEKPPASMVMITLGTGVGGGFILNNKIYSGGYTSFELGHIALIAEGRLCGCGKKGCFEKYCSISGLTATYNDLAVVQNKHLDLDRITVNQITSLADTKDSMALKALDTYALHLAHGIISIINLLTPEQIRIGGGLSELSGYYLPQTLNYVNMYVMPSYKNITNIEKATLGNNAALLGGYALAETALL